MGFNSGFKGLMIVPQPLPKPVLHTVWSSTSSFTFPYPPLSWRSSCGWLLLLPRRRFTSILPSFFNNVFYKAVLTQDVTNPLILHIFIVLWIFHSFLTLFNTSFIFIVRKIHWSYLEYTSLRASWYRCNSSPLLCVKLHNSSPLIISPLISSCQQYAAVLSQFTALCIRMCAGQ